MPYPNEHACRLVDPAKCKDEPVGRVKRSSPSHGGKVYSVIRMQLKSTGEWVDQAYRYPKDTWTAGDAGDHCRSHKGSFEAARQGEGQSAGECVECVGEDLTEKVVVTRGWMRTPIARGLKAGQANPVDRENNIIHGYSVITEGEAEGHQFWIDDVMSQQVLAAINGAPKGLKTRFTHPGLCSDGLGKFLGRTRNAFRDGNVIRADLHLSPSAAATPDGDLAGYVMDLAQEDPEAFGASIVATWDGKARDAFRDQHLDADGRFVSPVPANVKNLPHYRIRRLHAADVVDDPAANPGGFMSAPEAGALAEAADRFLDWALGRSQTPPDDVAIGPGIETERAKTYITGYLGRRGLMIVPAGVGSELEETKMPPEKDPDVSLVDVEALEKGRNEGAEAAKARCERLRAAFPERAAFVLDEFLAGHDLKEAENALKDVLLVEQKAEIDRLNAEKAEAATAAAKVGTSAVATGGASDGAWDFMAEAEKMAKAENITVAAAMSRLGRLHPDRVNAWRAAQRK